MNLRRVLFWSGIGICVAGVLTAIQIPYFYYRSAHEGNALVHQAEVGLAGVDNGVGSSNPDSWNGNETRLTLQQLALGESQTLAGQMPSTLLGVVRVPSIQLVAPLLEGTDDSVLNVGVGHLSTSVVPGEPGRSVIAAHNATWFRHVDQLKIGDTIEVDTKQGRAIFQVTGHQIVKVGQPVPNTGLPTLALEACYPLNALYLTSERYLVFATLVHTDASDGLDGQVAQTALTQASAYHAQIPQRLLDEGVTLSDNALPMGSLDYTGTPNSQYMQSNAPLSATYSLLQLYFAFVHASEERDISSLYALLAHTEGAEATSDWANKEIADNPLYGAKSDTVSYTDSFHVTLDVQRSQLQAATATTTLQVGPSTYHCRMVVHVSKSGILTLQSVEFTSAGD